MYALAAIAARRLRISQGLKLMSEKRIRQPCRALVPHAFTLEALQHWSLDRSSRLTADRFRLTAFWDVDYVRQQVPGERRARYTMRLAQAESYGAAIDHSSPRQACDPNLIGEDCRHILDDRRYRDNVDRTGLIDLVVGEVTAQGHEVTFGQTMRDKYASRARLFADEATLVLRRNGLHASKATRPHIHVAGATAGILSTLLARGFKVTATDLSPDIVGQNLGGVTVCDAVENSRFIAAADLIIITGMTLPNGTLPSILETAKAFDTSTMVWAVTGRNLGQYYAEHGVDCVISDPSPFFQLPGPASIRIWRRET
jgi:putative heavy-metal chelation protein